MSRIRLYCCPRPALRLRLEAARPPSAVRGIHGMRVADQILKQYKVPGLLVGGLAKELWRGSTNPAVFSRHKDVDVLVLTCGCGRHPEQWEAGVDWWISHKFAERPTNGSDAGLVWMAAKRRTVRLSPGLYICPLELLKSSIRQERQFFADEFMVRGGRFKTLAVSEFPILPLEYLRVRWGDGHSGIAIHCRQR